MLSFFEKLPRCLVGIEACASSHHWSRELQALGHTVRLMPPAYVKPYVKRQKNDATDAEAICEAVSRPNMRFVETKTAEQQSCLMLHRTRHLFIRQQTAVTNAIRSQLAEFGVVAPVGRRGMREGYDGRCSMRTGAVVGRRAPAADSTVSPTIFAVASPDTTTGAVMPRCAGGSIPPGRTPAGPISHTS